VKLAVAQAVPLRLVVTEEEEEGVHEVDCVPLVLLNAEALVAEAVGDGEEECAALPVAVTVPLLLTDVAALAVSVEDVVALPVEEGVAENEEEKVALAVAVAVPLLVEVAVAVAEGVSLVIIAFRTRWAPVPSTQNSASGETNTGLMGWVRRAKAPPPFT
jgi:hypothetical protein